MNPKQQTQRPAAITQPVSTAKQPPPPDLELHTSKRVRAGIGDPATRIAKLEQQVAALQAADQAPRATILRLRDFIEDTFDRARWDLPALSSLRSTVDQEARREQLGFLHACVTIWEKMGEATPDDIVMMVMAMSGQEDKLKGILQGQMVIQAPARGGPPPVGSTIPIVPTE